MSEHTARIDWKRDTPDFKYPTYTRDHDISLGTGVTVRGSAAAAYKGTPTLPNPEELYVASLSSCHMLTFLALAARGGFIVDRYEDEASGYLEKNAAGRMFVARVVLRPRIAFSGEKLPDTEALGKLHDASHHECFIASSVTTDIRVESRE